MRRENQNGGIVFSGALHKRRYPLIELVVLSMAMASPVQDKVDLFDDYCNFAGGLRELHQADRSIQDFESDGRPLLNVLITTLMQVSCVGLALGLRVEVQSR